MSVYQKNKTKQNTMKAVRDKSKGVSLTVSPITWADDKEFWHCP